ncbi:MAG: GTPase Era [Kiritimatiellae bacterium]|nr:GTPase Era [Kiritimatiellia bacterium]
MDVPQTLSDPFAAKAGDPAPHAGVVAVVGRTNAGKSTLVNRLVGEKVSIVSPVAQTTRSVVRGVLTEPRGQIAFLDTPGLHKSQNLLGAEMNKRARASLGGADAALLVVDAARAPQLEDDGWMRRLVRSEIPVFVFLNKTDEKDRSAAFRELWDRVRAEDGKREAEAAAAQAARDAAPATDKLPPWKRKGRARRAPAPFAEPAWIRGSAKTGDGVEPLLDALFGALPPGPLLFDGDTVSDHPRRVAVADVVREKLFRLLHDELPHDIGVRIDDIAERPGAPVEVRGTVLVCRAGQKGIVLGEKGRTLRAATRASEKDLEEFFGRPVRVSLWIRVEPDWNGNFFLLRQLGYV